MSNLTRRKRMISDLSLYIYISYEGAADVRDDYSRKTFGVPILSVVAERVHGKR